MSMMPADGSLMSGLSALPGFFSVRFSHEWFLSAFQSKSVTRFFFTRNELFAGTMSLSKYVFTSLSTPSQEQGTNGAAHKRISPSCGSPEQKYVKVKGAPVVLPMKTQDLHRQT